MHSECSNPGNTKSRVENQCSCIVDKEQGVFGAEMEGIWHLAAENGIQEPTALIKPEAC